MGPREGEALPGLISWQERTQLSRPQETHQGPPVPGGNDRKQEDISRQGLGPSDTPGKEQTAWTLRATVITLLLYER